MPRAILCGNVQENAAPQDRDTRFARACTMEMHMDMITRAILCCNLQEKCRAPGPRWRLCAILRSRNAFGHVTRAFLCGNVWEKCRAPGPRRRLCAILHSRNALAHVTRAISCGNLRENAAPQSEHLDQAAALTPTVRTPQCGHTVWGKQWWYQRIRIYRMVKRLVQLGIKISFW